MKSWVSYGPKEAAALERWDKNRGKWKIQYFLDGSMNVSGLRYPCMLMPGSADYDLPSDSMSRPVEKTIRKAANVHIPDLERQRLSFDSCDQEGWEEPTSSLFEWVGMAVLGSPR